MILESMGVVRDQDPQVCQPLFICVLEIRNIDRKEKT